MPCVLSGPYDWIMRAGGSVPCVLSGSHDWTVRVWDAGGSSGSSCLGNCWASLQGHAGPVHALHVAQPPHGASTAAASDADSCRASTAAQAAHSQQEGPDAADAGMNVANGMDECDEGARGAGCGRGRGIITSGGPLLLSGGEDGALGVWDLVTAVGAQLPAAHGAEVAAAAATWGGAPGGLASSALPGCMWLQRVHRGGGALLGDGTAPRGGLLAGGVDEDAWAARVGGALVVSGARDGTLCAWRAPSLPLLPPPGCGAEAAAAVRGGVAHLPWSVCLSQEAAPQGPLQLLGSQRSRAAATSMALDPVTGVVVAGGHDGQLRAWAPFAA